MKGEAGNHGFFCLGDVLVKDKVTDAVIYWHGADGVDRLEDMGMMAYDSGYSYLGKSVGKGSLTDAGVGLKLYSPMEHHHDMGIGIFTVEIPDFIEQFIFCGLGNAWFIVDSAPVLYREGSGIEQSHADTVFLDKDRRHLFLVVTAIA